MGTGLVFSLEEEKKWNIIRLEGRLDATSAPVLEEKIESLLHEGKTQLVIDFARVDYLSSAGLRFLLAATKKHTARGGKLTIAHINEEVMEIIKMAGFERILHIFSSEEQAIAAFTL